MKENAAAEGTPAHGVLNDLFLPDPREDPAQTHEPELPNVSSADLPDDEATRNAEEDVLPPVERGESPKPAAPAPLAIGWHVPLNGPLVEEAATTSVAENTDMLDENAHKYVGLTNQAMTCYLNSLIQSIYMTPEFRNTIFKIERKRSPRDIQFQLQKLFVQLQTSDKISLPTVDLTNSFGWENEGIYQHDVQELFRLMIEALEKKWASTEHKGCIENLYKGDIVDYVKCLKCKTMKRKNDMFLDLSLAVKSDGAFFPHKSLEESISAFIKPEVLDGNNKYRCDNCDSLEDAEKGLQITEFPYLLAVQLKRFGFDYNTFHRIKLNDRLAFPDYLDLNPYVYKEPEPPKPQPPRLSYAQMAAKVPPPPPPPPPMEEPKLPSEDGAWLNVPPDAEAVQQLLKKGKYIYELFSVMVHQGSASGGHYYAFIKNLDQQRWFCFNDSTVSKATVEEVQLTFGGSSHFGFNSTNAYMLMYRRVDPARNEHFPRTPELPEHMKRMLEEMLKEERRQAEEREKEKEMVDVHVICNDRKTIGMNPLERWIHKDESYESLLRRLCAEYPGIAVEDARLIRCTPNWAMVEEMPENKDEPPLCTPYRHQNQHAHIRFKLDVYVMIDTKEGADFHPFPSGGQGITTEVHICNLDDGVVTAAKRVCVPADAKVGDLKTAFCAIQEVRESDPQHLRFLYDRYRDENQFPDLWEDDEVEIKAHSRYHRENLSIFVDVGSPETLAEDRAIADFKETKFCRAIERKKFGFQARFDLPPTSEYFRVALAPPNSRTGARSPVPSPFVQLQGEMKPILSDNSATSSSAASSCGPPADYDVCPPYDRTEPFEATAALPTNIPEPKSNSLSATSTYSSTPSGTMPTVPEPANTLDADQMEDLIRNSTAPPSSSTPPPPYGLPDEPPAIVPAEQTAHDPLSADVVQKFFPTEVPHDPYVQPLLEPVDFSGMNGYQRLNDEDGDLADLPSALEREGDADSLCCHSNTPKETSPNVSDEEGAEEEHFRRNEDMKYNLKGLVSPFSPEDGHDQYERPCTPSLPHRIQQKMDEHTLGTEEEYQSTIFPHRPPPLAKEEDDVFGNEEASRPAHYEVAVLQTGYEDETKFVRLQLDSRQTVGELQKWMADYLGLKESNVAFEKQYKEDSMPFPVNAATMTTLRECFSDIYKVIVKLQVTAREDENVVNIHMYHPQEPNVDKWPVLFRLAIAAECVVSALLSKCQALLLTVYNETYPLEQLRLRKVTSEGCILYHNNDTITPSRNYYNHETYHLQVIDSLVCSPELLKKPDSRLCSVMARRWCPSKFEVLPMIELFVEESESFGESLRAALSARSGIPPERLAISDFLPDSNDRDVRFPYTRPVLELLDKKIAFSQEFDKLTAQNGKLVYFKDVEEAEKTATDEERRYIRNKDQREAQLSMTNTYRRVERPLRIQVASESEP